MLVDDKPWTSPSNPGETYLSAQIDEAPGTSAEGKGSTGLGTLVGAHRRLQPDESAGFGAQGINHVAYRNADRGSMSTGRHQLKHQQQKHQPAAGEAGWGVLRSRLPVAVRNVNDRTSRRVVGPRTNLREEEHIFGEDEDVEGREERAETHQEGQREGDLEQRSLLEAEGFRQSDVGWGGERDPFGAVPGCPSTPRVVQIGIAMDAGMFKVRPLVVLQIARVGGMILGEPLTLSIVGLLYGRERRRQPGSHRG